jgi:hypothetical protein
VSIHVTLVEELGAETYVYGTATGVDGRELQLVARAPGAAGVQLFQDVKVAPNRVYVFEANDEGKRLS